MIILQFSSYRLRDWLFFSNGRSFLILDLYQFINPDWSSNHIRFTYAVGSWVIVDDLSSQVVVFLARDRPSIAVRFAKIFILSSILRAGNEKTSILTDFFRGRPSSVDPK